MMHSRGIALAPTQPAAERLSGRVCVGVATRGRPELVRNLVLRLRRQTLRPERIVVACVEAADVEGLSPAPDIQIVFSAPGLAKQRNLLLDHADADYLAYFDDDFIPDDRWLEMAVAQFEADPAIAGVTGNVVADGVVGPGLTLEEGERALASAHRRGRSSSVENCSPYGCNMAFRVSALAGQRFDERLVLYGWQEDRDYGARLAASGGRLVKLGAALGVHLGVKRGRMSGKRLGYSQIANVHYLFAKGSLSAPAALSLALSNFCANLARAPWPEAYIDRRGRLLGNALAILDLLSGACAPERAELL